MILSRLRNVPENVRKRVRQNALGLRRIRIARHGVRFAGAGLSVRQNRAIVAFEHFVDNRSCGVHIQIDLVGQSGRERRASQTDRQFFLDKNVRKRDRILSILNPINRELLINGDVNID